MIKLLIIWIFIIFPNICIAEVSAWIENNPVKVGVIFKFHIEAKNLSDTNEPNLTNIAGLEIVNRSVQNKTSIVGTSVARSVKWTYSMIATSAGNYLIPAIRIGNEVTSPISLKAVKLLKSDNSQRVRLEIEISPDNVYIQEQVIIRLKIIRLGLELENESVTPFSIDGAQVEKLHQKSFRNFSQGKRELITEISYVLFPERSGIITVPEIAYQGDEILGSNYSNRLGNFGNIFKQRGQRVFLRSEAKTIEVKELPLRFKGWWLPSTKLDLDEKWLPENSSFIVGEPITRTLSVHANGVFGDQIPQFIFEVPDKIKSYADKPLIETDKNEYGVRGSRIEKWVIIPSEPGEFVFPEVKVEWWEVKKDEINTSFLPSRTIYILPKNNAIEDIPQNKDNFVNKQNEPARVSLNPLNHSDNEENYWRGLTILFALLWFSTITILFFFKKKTYNQNANNITNTKTKKVLALEHATKKVQNALSSGDAEIIQKALLNWSESLWTENPPQGIEQIGERIPELKNGIKSLNSLLYGNNGKKDTLEDLQKQFYKLSLANNVVKKNIISELSPMYPD